MLNTLNNEGDTAFLPNTLNSCHVAVDEDGRSQLYINNSPVFSSIQKTAFHKRVSNIAAFAVLIFGGQLDIWDSQDTLQKAYGRPIDTLNVTAYIKGISDIVRNHGWMIVTHNSSPASFRMVRRPTDNLAINKAKGNRRPGLRKRAGSSSPAPHSRIAPAS